MKKNITPFYAIIQDINKQEFVPYDVMRYFMNEWNWQKSHKRTQPLPTSYEELTRWVKDKSMYMYWARCEYEMILVGWPDEKTSEKWDIHKQLMMNLPLLVRIFAENISFDKYLEKLSNSKNIK